MLARENLDLTFDPEEQRLTSPIAYCNCGKKRAISRQHVREGSIDDWICSKCFRGASGRNYNPVRARRCSTPTPLYADFLEQDAMLYHDDDEPLPADLIVPWVHTYKAAL